MGVCESCMRLFFASGDVVVALPRLELGFPDIRTEAAFSKGVDIALVIADLLIEFP